MDVALSATCPSLAVFGLSASRRPLRQRANSPPLSVPVRPPRLFIRGKIERLRNSESGMRYAILFVAVFFIAACDQTRLQPKAKKPPERPKAAAALPASAPAPPPTCEQRFRPIGMALTRAALDTRTGQDCRTAENAPLAFRSLPMCVDLFIRDMPAAESGTASQAPTRPCQQRFTPIGTALTRAAVDTKTGQMCRTAENAPPAFHSAPLCSDLVSQFPD
jgi:hypothetical protein